MKSIVQLIEPFIDLVKTGQIDIYNEFSLQHEIGIFLRSSLPNAKIQFERNVGNLFGSKTGFGKREIDIVVYEPKLQNPSYAIELKYPRNGQYPEQMYSFCKDIAFAEQLHAAGCAQAALVIFADDALFYRGNCDGIYGYFRGQRPLSGPVQKPTGAKDSNVVLRGKYVVSWIPIIGDLACTVVEVGGDGGDMDF